MIEFIGRVKRRQYWPLKGILLLVVLKLLRPQPMYGKQIVDTIEKKYNVKIPKSVIYFLLRRLEKRGIVTSEWDTGKSGPARRVYVLTEFGVEFLEDKLSKIKKILPVLEDLVS